MGWLLGNPDYSFLVALISKTWERSFQACFLNNYAVVREPLGPAPLVPNCPAKIDHFILAGVEAGSGPVLYCIGIPFL